jgi:hypothetical protein
MATIRKKLKYFIIGALFIFFFLTLGTGVIKFPGLLNFFGIDYVSLPFYQINLIHDWSGIIFIFLVIVHLVLNWQWIKDYLSLKIDFFGAPIKIWYLLIIFLIVLATVFSSSLQNYAGGGAVKELAAREIKEYQGEKLSSLSNVPLTSIGGVQHIDPAAYSLEISGLVENPKNLTYEQVLSFDKYSKVVKLNCVVGWSAKLLWEGVLLKDVLDAAGIMPEAKIVIFYAKDGFTTSLPLDFIIDKDILLAYKVNGVVLPPENGFPFQLVAEQKWGYKWIKWLTRIELSDDINYEGTYESSGYSNEADIGGPRFGD